MRRSAPAMSVGSASLCKSRRALPCKRTAGDASSAGRARLTSLDSFELDVTRKCGKQLDTPICEHKPSPDGLTGDDQNALNIGKDEKTAVHNPF